MMASATGTTAQVSERVVVYGADWCGDCRNTKEVLTREGVAFDYIDLMADASAAHQAEAISGQRHIPVVIFPDGVYYVEPTKVELTCKIAALRAEGFLATL